MNAPRLLFVFALAFVLGIGGAVLVMHTEHAATAPAATSNEDRGADNDAKSSTDADSADAPAWPDDAGTPEQVFFAQPQRVDEAIAKLAPRAPNRVNLYLVAFAGDGEENVFRNEVEFVERQFAQRFDAAGHTLALINHVDTLKQQPLATLSNLQRALQGVAAQMDPDRDVLFLFLTSHGSHEHELYVSLDPLPLDQIGPDDLASALEATPIRWKVIVISACYAGGFIDALKDPGTLVITAADAEHSSFGCGTASEITDFGRAFFVEGLNHNDSFDAAFAEAKHLIEQWEDRDGNPHSRPQIVTTPQIEAQLKTWRAQLKLGAPVPFDRSARRPPVASGQLTARR